MIIDANVIVASIVSKKQTKYYSKCCLKILLIQVKRYDFSRFAKLNLKLSPIWKCSFSWDPTIIFCLSPYCTKIKWILRLFADIPLYTIYTIVPEILFYPKDQLSQIVKSAHS